MRIGAVVSNNTRSIESQIKAAEKELANLKKRKIQLENEIKHLRNIQHSIAEKTSSFNHKTKPGITSLRGEFQDYGSIKVMPTFHPSYLIRNEGNRILRKKVWEDMKKVMAFLGKT